MKPSAYISDGGVMFKDPPPDSILKLNPLYTSAEIKELHNLLYMSAEIKELHNLLYTSAEIKELHNLVEKQRAEINCLKNKYNNLSSASLNLCNIVDKVTDE